MKKIIFLLFTSLMFAMSANAVVTVCDIGPDGNGNFSSPYIKSGSIKWDKNSKTLTLNNAIIEYSSSTPYDFVYPICISDDATIVIQGECKVMTTGFVALSFSSYDVKNITITGDGSLYTSSTWVDISIGFTRLTIKDINLETVMGISDNGTGNNVALTFDNVQATINDRVERVGEGITFIGCAITYPADAYISDSLDYGYAIYCGNDDFPDKIIISRLGGNRGDVNGDGSIDVADVTSLIAKVLGNPVGIFHSENADLNDDGIFDVSDVIALIKLVLNNN